MTTDFTATDRAMMARALQLARNGELHASPNPMVGAVIYHPASERIIGEGWHRRCGEGHAEVNAVASVAESLRPLLRESTIYVTLEPCSHYGKTPPCAKLLVETGFRRVVTAMLDPFEKVAGRGVEMLRRAGIDVQVGLMETEARELNRKFITAHTLRRPFVTLKWAESADGYIDGRNPGEMPALISTPVTAAAVHKLRAEHDAIIIGSGTWEADRPRLDVRHYAGTSPRRMVACRSKRLNLPEGFEQREESSVKELLEKLYSEGVTSLLVEGGATLLQEFINAGAYDAVRVETNPSLRLGDKSQKTLSPQFKRIPDVSYLDKNLITNINRI